MFVYLERYFILAPLISGQALQGEREERESVSTMYELSCCMQMAVAHPGSILTEIITMNYSIKVQYEPTQSETKY